MAVTELKEKTNYHSKSSKMEAAEEALIGIIRKTSRVRTTTVGKVKSISGDTCVVEREDLPDLEDVRLNAVSGDFEDLMMVYPKIGSEVMVLQVENAAEENAIVKYTEIDKVLIKIGGASFEMSAGKFEFRNTEADLKKILKETFDTLRDAKIDTPDGPMTASFNALEKIKFESLKADADKLFK